MSARSQGAMAQNDAESGSLARISSMSAGKHMADTRDGIIMDPGDIGRKSEAQTARRLIARVVAYCAFPIAAGGYASVYTLALRTGPTGLVHATFWLCTLLAICAIQLLIRSGCKDAEGGLIAGLMGALFYLPKYFRSPHFFDYHDELAHWYATHQLLSGHGAFVANPDNAIVQYYPGLHLLTGALSSMSGLSVFAAGNIVCAWAHVLTCLAVYGLCRQLNGGPGLALTAALLFAANPAFFYFDAQFSYETLGVAFFAVVLLCAIRIATSRSQLSWAEVSVMSLVVLTLVITHHVTSYVLAVTLTTLFGTCAILWRRSRASRHRCWQLAALAGISVGASLTWLLIVAPKTVTYIRGPVLADLTAFRNYLGVVGHARSPRQLFAGARIPAYEVYLSYAAILVLFGLYLWTLASLRDRSVRGDPRQWTLLLLGAVYFGSLPVVFAFSDQTAKRPWAFAFVGLAVVCAPAIFRLLHCRSGLLWLAGLAVVVTLYVGGVVTLSGDDIRFPGTYNPASDALSTTPDLIAAAAWIHDQYGNGNSLIANEPDANVFGSYGFQDPRTYQGSGYEPWNVFFPSQLGPKVYSELKSDDARFVAVDLRMATGRLFPGTYYFSAMEPGAGSGIRPFDLRSLTKFRYGPFIEVFNDGYIQVWEYRNWVNPSATQESSKP